VPVPVVSTLFVYAAWSAVAAPAAGEQPAVRADDHGVPVVGADFGADLTLGGVVGCVVDGGETGVDVVALQGQPVRTGLQLTDARRTRLVSLLTSPC
jgi:hypothetical protein